MNIFKELNRVKSYKTIDPWFEQKTIVSVNWGKTIVVDILNLDKDTVKSMYLPTFSNGRYIELNRLTALEYYDRVMGICSYSI